MIDPYLSEYALQQWGMPRAIPPAIDHTRFDPTILLSSHWHEDHLDQPIIRHYAARPEVLFGGPPASLARAIAWGWPRERTRLLGLGCIEQVGDVTITAVFARHDAEISPSPDAVGFVVDLAGYRVWDVADTEYDSRLRPMAGAGIDLALVPINGVGGNLTDREAALLMSYVKPGIAVPMHYDMWVPEVFGPGATLDPAVFVDTYRLLGGGETRVLERGEIVEFRK
jgi:L-ascorbate metabolism protein UlaG (beta-lactamase superfamily)